MADLPEQQMEMAEQPMDQSEVILPDKDKLVELFEVVTGEPLDENDEAHAEMMQQIVILLSQDPELSSALASGEMTVAEFALQLFREMEQGQPE
jgi:hypothetical protein